MSRSISLDQARTIVYRAQDIQHALSGRYWSIVGGMQLGAPGRRMYMSVDDCLRDLRLLRDEIQVLRKKIAAAEAVASDGAELFEIAEELGIST